MSGVFTGEVPNTISLESLVSICVGSMIIVGTEACSVYSEVQPITIMMNENKVMLNFLFISV